MASEAKVKRDKRERRTRISQDIILQQNEEEEKSSPEEERKTEPMENGSSVVDIDKKRRLLDTIEDGQKIKLTKGQETYELEVLGKLGEGGFGAVYKCKSDSGQIYALKKILTRGRGIPCLMEASISMSYAHPYINKAIIVNATADGIYILQDMAKYDIHNWRKKNKPSEDQIKNIFYKTALAIAYFHKQGIVHGDVKPSNILYFNEDDIRLTDFNLTTYVKWRSSIHLCTSTYRPYELWNRKSWNEKIDIWSLGCSIFEIVYNKSLIPWQGNDRLARKRYMNCIAEWAEFNSKHQKVKKTSVNYHGPRIPHSLKHGDDINTPLMKLILKCLQIHPADRPSIDTILSDRYFDSIRLASPPTVSPSSSIVTLGFGTDRNFYNQIKKELSDYVPQDDMVLLEAATNICSEFVKRRCYNNFVIKKVCVWIAKKLIRFDVAGQEIPNADRSLDADKILETEIFICDTLGFKLH